MPEATVAVFKEININQNLDMADGWGCSMPATRKVCARLYVLFFVLSRLNLQHIYQLRCLLLQPLESFHPDI
jgi:hypothetical protein